MCGIAGYMSSAPTATDVLERMTRSLAHRGPDAEGFFREGPAALGHRRLSVIDLEGSPQPMSTADGDLTIVYNGEIYNYRELRSELQSRGHVFRTRGDTEVLLHAYREFGTGMLERLRGMFAFAIWERSRQRMLLARDPFGVKPLYYSWDGRTLVFGSELKAVRAHPAVGSELDLDALGLYVECQYIPAPLTAYRNIRKLPAAHGMLVEDGSIGTWQYWKLGYLNKVSMSEQEAVDATEAALRESIRGMLIADVPLGCLLSGGVDSSLVAALASDILGRSVDTFHLGFNVESPSNEHVEAEKVARHIGARHHVLLLDPSDLLGGLDDWIDIFDEPFGDPAALPTMLLSQLARRDVTVVLTGEGADEILGGYDNYQKRLNEERISGVLGSRFSPLRYVVPHLPALLRRDRILRPIGEPVARRYATIPNIFDQAVLPTLFTPQFQAQRASTIVDYAERFYLECDSPHYVERIMHVDARLWLIDDLLVKVDRATMSVSLEARVPYLDHRFAEFAASLPPLAKRRPETGKYVLKKLAERYLPRDLVYRRKKGFTLPLSEWIAGPLRAGMNDAMAGLAKRGIFRDGVLDRLMAQQERGRSRTGRLWTLLILERWLARYAPDFRA
jgi:asparagine synthase (glutamine-hydrolysing)